MNCPNCSEACYRDEVNVGVGVITGPWGCPACGWSSDPEYDFSGDKDPIQPDGSVLDQYGGIHPKDSVVAKVFRSSDGRS